MKWASKKRQRLPLECRSLGVLPMYIIYNVYCNIGYHYYPTINLRSQLVNSLQPSECTVALSQRLWVNLAHSNTGSQEPYTP